MAAGVAFLRKGKHYHADLCDFKIRNSTAMALDKLTPKTRFESMIFILEDKIQ